ncbi:MAG TPA: cysteine hydrolase family protein [Sphingobacteriaceae bacterium]
MNTDTALLLIDFQQGFGRQEYFGGNRNNTQAEENARLLLDYFRQHSLPVIHTRHNSVFENSPLRAGQSGNDFIETLVPHTNEIVIDKSVNSAFIGTNLDEILKKGRIRKLIVGGLVTNHCVSTTARMAANMGYEIVVVADATAAFDQLGFTGEKFSGELVHQVSLASLRGEFGEIMTTAEILEKLSSAESNYVQTTSL